MRNRNRRAAGEDYPELHNEIDSIYADFFKDEDAITKEEKRQILDQIRQIAPDSQGALPAAVRPPRKGYFFPLMVNLGVAAVTAAAIGVSVLMFRQHQEKLEAATGRYGSLEGEILEEYKRETSKKLEEKDSAILSMLNQLGALERERRQLADIMEIRVQQKEQELRGSLEAELARMRQALLAEGLHSEQADQRLKEYESVRQQEALEELRAYQEEAERMILERTAQLLREKEAAQQALEQATREREAVLLDEHPVPMEVLSAEPSGTPPDQALIARLQEELKAREMQIENLQQRPLPSAPLSTSPAERPAAETAATDPSYRVFGTVTLTRADQVVILPMIGLPATAGSPIEIRRVLASGKTVRVAGGRVLGAEGEKLIARIEVNEEGYQPVVTDKVYLRLEPE